MGKLRILSPVGVAQPRPSQLAPRRGDIRGQRLGILENGKAPARGVLEQIAGALEERYGLTRTYFRRKARVSLAASPELIHEAAEKCDLVLLGVGD